MFSYEPVSSNLAVMLDHMQMHHIKLNSRTKERQGRPKSAQLITTNLTDFLLEKTNFMT